MKNFLPIVLFSFIFICSGNSISAQNCLVAEYYLDGDATDSTGSFNGTMNGSPTAVQDRNNNSGSALEFDGISDYIELPTDFDFKRRTINLWFYADTLLSTSSEEQIYGSDHPNLTWGSTFLIPLENQGVDVLRYMVGANSSLGQHEEPINEKEWYMATIVVDSNDVDYYLNCQFLASKVNTFNSSQSASTYNSTLGTNRNLNNFFEGKIDNVKIYDCNLTITEICDIYTTGIERLTNEPASFNVYPNPSEGEINLNWDGKELSVRNIEMHSTTGKLVYDQQVYSNRGEITVSPELKGGLYFVSFIGEQGERLETKKVIVN